MKIKVNTSSYQPRVENNYERLHDGYLKILKSYKKDYYETLNRKIDLPKDWRSIILK